MTTTQGDIDRRLSTLVDLAASVVEGAHRYEQRSRQLIQNLDALRLAMANQASTYESQTKAALGKATDTMARDVTSALLATFSEANRAADEARLAYDSATRRLGGKLFAFALLLQAILFGVGWLLVQRTIPSYADLELRRQQVADLDHQIQIEQKTLDFLDRKGGRIQWGQCDRHFCFRVDAQHPYVGTDDATKKYFIPWGYW